MENLKIQQNDEMLFINNNGTIIAKLLFEINGDLLTINSIFVNESLRGKGVAKMLFDKIIEKAKLENKKVIPICSYSLLLFQKNKNLESLWHKNCCE